MKNLQLICSTLIAVFTLSYLSPTANALYYRAYPKKYQCFKDMISTNYTLEMEVSIVDKEPLDNILDANAQLKKEGKTKTEGVRMHLTGPERKDLFFGEVHPNV